MSAKEHPEALSFTDEYILSLREVNLLCKTLNKCNKSKKLHTRHMPSVHWDGSVGIKNVEYRRNINTI